MAAPTPLIALPCSRLYSGEWAAVLSDSNSVSSLVEAASMLDTASCWSSLKGDASHPITPLSGVPGEPIFHSRHPVFRRA